ncbi:MAG: c-type cytochrome [Sulfurimonadaceae bacterium]|nr:c-type cytochrome [Sulfurimonadaceae bacterium]
MRFIFTFVLLFSFLDAKTPYELGKNLYIQKGCLGCHGHNAEGMHNYPRLANRAKGFLTYKMKRFRDAKSDNQQQEMMIPFALGLSDTDIENIVVFLHEFVEDRAGAKYDDSYEVHGDGGS